MLKTGRRGDTAQLTICIHANRYARTERCSTDPGDKGGRLGSLRADADGVGLGRNTLVPDIDVVTARGQRATSSETNGDITVAGGIIEESIESLSHVVNATGVAKQRKPAISDVAATRGVVLERIGAIRRVKAAGGVAKERRKTAGRVRAAS